MPIRQPIQTIVQTSDFRDQAFSFPVKSVLGPQQGSGKLVVEASTGYLLTTSSDAEPKSVQTLDHVRQPDGRSIAYDTITVLAQTDQPADGSVVIRNSLNETLQVTIETVSSLLVQRPSLTISPDSLSFAKTSPGKPAFLVLTVTQEQADTPVTLSTDAPERFQFATDSHPLFTDVLTLTPSATGTYVHVRYTPDRAGLHVGQLLVQAPYETQTFTLTGRAAGLLPTVSNTPLPKPPTAEKVDRPASAGRRLGVPALLLLSGLAYAGYTYRCQLAPSLCREKTEPDMANHLDSSRDSEPATLPATNGASVRDKETKPPVARAEPNPPKASASRVARAADEKLAKSRPGNKLTLGESNRRINATEPSDNPEKPVSRPTPDRRDTDNGTNIQARRRRVTSPPVPEESELERELNKEPDGNK